MARAAVQDELPVHAGLAHFVLERGDHLGRRGRIVRAVEHEHLGLDVLRILRIRRVEPAVEADHPGHVRAAAREFQRHRASEAVADRRDAGRVNHLLFLQRLERGVSPFAHELAVGAVLRRLGPALVRGRGPHAFSVHVRDERDVAELSQLLGAAALVRARPSPFVEDHNTRPLASARIIVGQVGLQFDISVPVIHVPGLDRRESRRGQHGQDRQPQNAPHLDTLPSFFQDKLDHVGTCFNGSAGFRRSRLLCLRFLRPRACLAVG